MRAARPRGTAIRLFGVLDPQYCFCLYVAGSSWKDKYVELALLRWKLYMDKIADWQALNYGIFSPLGLFFRH